MTETYALAALWIGLALAAALASIWLRVATSLSEILVGTLAGAVLGVAALGVDQNWVKFLAGAGAILLTFLAGAEIDPDAFRRQWKEASAVGLVSFFAPFLGCAAGAYWLLGWNEQASLLAGIAMSTTSVAVVYAVMLEFGFNRTDYGKMVLAACFITDLGTVVGLGLIFAPFTLKTLAFVGGMALAALALPWLTPRFFKRYGGRPSELETKYLLLVLFGLGALAGWAESEAVLPAYVIGMLLAGTVGRDHALIRRFRTLTLGLLTPFYFLRAGSFVSVPALIAAPGRLPCHARPQARVEERGGLPRRARFRLAAQGEHLYDATHVHGTHLRNHLFALRPVARHRRSGAILGPGRRRGRERRRPDADRQRLVPATPPAAEGRQRRRGRWKGARATTEVAHVSDNRSGIRRLDGGAQSVRRRARVGRQGPRRAACRVGRPAFGDRR